MNREQYIEILELDKAELKKKNKDLQHQLEEKDKDQDQVLEKVKHIYNILNCYKENHIICFDKDLWGLYQRMDKELSEILERGKNGKR